MVHFVSRECICRAWQLNGLPCSHAIAAMRQEKVNIEDFVHPFYNTEKYKKAYAQTIISINGHNLWVETLEDPIHLPTFKDTKKLMLKEKARGW